MAMRETEKRIKEAIEIGQANKKTLKLIENWCAHVTTEPFGGIGIVEEQTGLPIGMRGLNCPHASDRGISAMDLQAVALEFYDRNCASCTQRRPVAMPNLSELVGQRDDERAKAKARAATRQALEARSVESRVARRRRIAANVEAARQSILTLVDQLDTDPTDNNAALLIESARAIPDSFDDAIQASLVELIETGGFRARASFETLSIVAPGSQTLGQAALKMLATGESPALAATMLGAHLRDAPASQIAAALPSIFELAAPPRFFESPSEPVPQPLFDAWHAAPSAVRTHMGVLLRSDVKQSRILACRCATTLLSAGHNDCMEFAGTALHSIGKPDDAYAPDGSAREAVSKLLGAALVADFAAMDALLQYEWRTASEEQRIAIVNAYEGVLRRKASKNETAGTSETASFKRIVDVISARKLDETFENVVDFLRYPASHFPDLVVDNAEALIGVAALLIEDAKERYSPLLDPRPSQLKQLDSDTLRQRARSGVNAIIELLGGAGASSSGVIDLVLSTLDGLDERAEDFRSALVKCLGQMGQSRHGLPKVLPAVYVAMMHRSQVVRSAGATAYGELARAGGVDLPRLMHETFLLLLQDRFVIVHQAAVAALRTVRLPEDLNRAAAVIVRMLAEVYSESGDRDSFLMECVMQYLRLTRGMLTRAGRSQVNAILLKMPPFWAARVLSDEQASLSGVPEYADAVVRALCTEGLTDSRAAELFGCLGELPVADISRLSDQLATLGDTLHPAPGQQLERLVDLVANAADWENALRIAQLPLKRLEDVPRDRRLLRIAKLRVVATKLEASIAGRRLSEVAGLLKDWGALRRELDSEEQDLAEEWPLIRVFDLRCEALSALSALGDDLSEFDRVTRSAEQLSKAASSVAKGGAFRGYTMFATALRSVAYLQKWGAAVRSAEQDADRFLRAAKQASKDASKDKNYDPKEVWAFAQAFAAIDAVKELDDVVPILGMVSAVPLPPPFFTATLKPREATDRVCQSPPAPCIVFVSFTIDGVPLTDPHVVTPDELHDLDVTVKASRWPEGCQLVLDALTVEPQPAISDFPKFVLERPVMTASLHQTQKGRMRISVAQPIAARPLEFVYRAYFSPDTAQTAVHVEGERRLRLRSYDPERNPVTGYRLVDQRLLEIRDELRRLPGVQDGEIDNLLLVLATLGQLAGESLQDNIFPTPVPEAEFQKRLRERFRLVPKIGAALQEHANVARGITDLSFKEMVIELKIENDKMVVLDGIEGYSQQAAQYTTGNDKRLGVLCVLDSSQKRSAPGSVLNDIALRLVPPPGDPNGVPLVLAVVVVRGNLPRPSDLSR